MDTIKIHHIQMLALLWLLPLLGALFYYAARQRAKALRLFFDPGMLEKTGLAASRPRRFWKAVLLMAALVCLIAALARPAWDRKDLLIKRSGRDLVFLLDVSKSMLAADLAPNRLEQAKLAISDTIDRLQGDRVGLVAFAGTAVVKCPLTLDYGFFRMSLDDIDVQSVSRGGTMIGDALRTVLSQVFDDQAKQYKDIILITDGEDHDSFPLEAAQAAAEKGVRLIIIGLGDEHEGQRIPTVDEQGRQSFLKYQGQEVWSRLDAATLRQMAQATPGGRYLPVATGTINLGEVYLDLVVSAEQKELATRTMKQYEEKFQIFLVLAFLLLVLEMMVSERKSTGIMKQG